MLPLHEHERQGLRFVCTCTVMPEQYDVYRGSELVGYIRSRHGHFTVAYPDVDGVYLHDGDNDGYGGFTDSERHHCLERAASLIRHELEKA